MTAAADNGYRDRLRGATGSAHVRLDARFALGIRNTVHYRTYLLGMHAFVANAERALADAKLGPTWGAWRDPARASWLVEDLAVLSLDALPESPRIAIDSDADAAGLLYVIEGSALGATQLVGDAQALGHGPGTGATFLFRHGGLGAGKRWRAFVAALERADFDGAGERSMLESAARAFASAEHEFHRAELACTPLT
ncbi:biliverdin-producing heme oxygenase [Lysobacter sp. A6]|uniref:Biliverdin-producing heme oxygenase n=1 Tax=Noviluteimonas lactosilytica TaxID=2888523 RepID=A0ABS8JHE0_9GAMM|nr:biliverdin-producing heme oxygenase [Lysobacter lactosilyticus]MCC8362979.1 biliverdin-producing heme oxygenase [Lysobacter lactosilyticus]